MGSCLLLAAFAYVLLAPTTDEDFRKRMVTEAMARSIATSVESFSIENGNLPVPKTVGSAPDAKFVTDATPGVEILEILMGKDLTGNPRAVSYLKMKERKDRKSGPIYDKRTGKLTALLDAWGNPYHLVLDTDYNEEITVNLMGKDEKIPGKRVLVYSAGKDGKLETADDIRSW